MLIVLSLAQMPPSFIALEAFFASSHQYRINLKKEGQLVATESARTLDDAIDILAYDARNALDEEGSYDYGDTVQCTPLINHLYSLSFVFVDYALMDTSGHIVCKSEHFSGKTAIALPFKPTSQANFYNVDILEKEGKLQFTFLGGRYPLSKYIVIGEIGQKSLFQMINKKVTPEGAGLFLTKDSQILPLLYPEQRLLKHSHPIVVPTFGGMATLIYDNNLPPFRELDLFFILLPILIWFSTAIIGWLVMHYMLLRPLRRMQKAITDYGQSGEISEIKPASLGAAKEIRQVSKAFYHVAVRLASHERALRIALEHQKMLTREVHHRVKNNLQVVASLLSIHSRRAQSAREKATYTAIQRRVDALAIVQRQYYNQLDLGYGLDLPLMIKDLVRSLQTNLPSTAKNFHVETDIDDASVPLEKAMPIAFIIVEIADFALSLDIILPLKITLHRQSSEDKTSSKATLTIESEAIKQLSTAKDSEIIKRIINAFGRQLGGKFSDKEDEGYFHYDIDILPS